MKKYILYILILGVAISLPLKSQHNYWQQKADYEMQIDFNVENHQFNGTQILTYYNNSPDTLTQVFYHLYFNAFQPGSMMDVRNRTIADPSSKIKDRILFLDENEIGYLHVDNLKQNGTSLNYEEVGTILEVDLDKPIFPGEKAVFNMEFRGQVPLQIRRSGRDNSEGIAYSMSQWYPKMSEYDFMGWHANPYIGREFYGIWGDFDVRITIDPSFVIGGTGYLQNPNEIGHGYEDKGINVKHKKGEPITWHFKAPNVHDFMWGADPDYTHVKKQVPNGGPMMHFFYQPGKETKNWEKLPELATEAFAFISEQFGQYPYDQYSIVQGGDGGMEYPMSTLITGHRNLGSLLGVTVHEFIHSWYQGVIGTNESLYSWMDEGFTSYASSVVMNEVMPSKRDNIHSGSYRGYFFNVSTGEEEPMTIHSDHYITNRSYSINAYSKGAVFLNQLNYIMGQETFMKAMRRYFNTWKFKHPHTNDFIRIMEKESGLELDWYKEHFIFSTNTIDYSIDSVYSEDNNTIVSLRKNDPMMMPIEAVVTKKDNSQTLYYIPLVIMRGMKKENDSDIPRIVKEDWPWTHPEYHLEIEESLDEIKSIEIDPSQRMADINAQNNTYNPR